VALNFNDILREQQAIFDNISDEARFYKEEVNRIDRELSAEDFRKAAFQLAFTRAYQYTRDRAAQLLLLKIKEAAIATEEYNYAPYLSHLENAVRSNINSGIPLITILPDENARTAHVYIDLTPLGGVELWAAAVKKARDDLPGKRWEDGDMRSRQWMRLIYGTAREGRKAWRVRRDKETGEEDFKDITADWSWRYDAIVKARLSYLAPTEAPFWYLIEYGNASVEGAEGGSVQFHSEGHSAGWPYPEFGPQWFIQETEILVANLIREAYSRFIAEAVEKLNEVLSDIVKRGTGLQPRRPFTSRKPSGVAIGEGALQQFHERLEEIYANNLQNTEEHEKFKVDLERWRNEMKEIDNEYVYVVFYWEHHREVTSYWYLRGTKVDLE